MLVLAISAATSLEVHTDNFFNYICCYLPFHRSSVNPTSDVVDDIINNTIIVRYNPNMRSNIRGKTIKHHQKAITSSQMYEIEEKAHTHFGFHRLDMMENAGHGVADFVNAKYKKRSGGKIRLVAVCGTGNNGGDGFVAARHLSGYPGYAISVILLGRTSYSYHLHIANSLLAN